MIHSLQYILHYFWLKKSTITCLALNKCLKAISYVWFHYLTVLKGRKKDRSTTEMARRRAESVTFWGLVCNRAITKKTKQRKKQRIKKKRLYKPNINEEVRVNFKTKIWLQYLSDNFYVFVLLDKLFYEENYAYPKGTIYQDLFIYVKMYLYTSRFIYIHQNLLIYMKIYLSLLYPFWNLWWSLQSDWL